MSLHHRTIQDIPPRSEDGGRGFEAGAASTIVYIKGPEVLFVSFVDQEGGSYNFPMTPGDQYELPPGRYIQSRIECINVEANSASAEFMIGSGKYTTATGEGGVETPRYISTASVSSANVGQYSIVGISVPATSLYLVEVLEVFVFPSSTDPISMTYVGAGVESQTPYYDVGIISDVQLHPFDEGEASAKSLSGVRDTATPSIQAQIYGDDQEVYWGGVFGLQETIHINMEATPFILKPGSQLVFNPGVTNVACRAIIIGRERRA